MPVSRSLRKQAQESWLFLRELYQRFAETRIALAAGAISFFTLLSLFPLLLLILSFVPVFLDRTQLVGALGDEVGAVIYDQIIDRISRGLAGVSLFFGFWAGSQVFLVLEAAMNQAWHAHRRRPFWVRRGLALLMVLIVGVLLIGTVFLANGVRLIEELGLPLSWRSLESAIVRILLTLVLPTGLICAVFGAVYRILPARNVTLRTVWPGALIAGILWMVSLKVFSFYVARFANYSLLYGSLSNLVLLLIWFYYSALILLLGAEISALYHRRLVEAGEREERTLEEDERLQVPADALLTHAKRREEIQRAMAYYGYEAQE